MAPEPENVKLEVTSSDCRGKRKIKEHCSPEKEGGMSKLKMELISGVISPKKDVP